MIINDHVFTDFLCNLRCSYCSCDVDLMKRKGDILSLASSKYGQANQESVIAFLQRNLEVIKLSKKKKPTPILKISGGEIFLIPEFIEFLPSLTCEFAIIKILTNGTLMNSQIVEQIRKFSNIHIQVSLDGHTLEMNTYRFNNYRILASILKNIGLLYYANIPLEINCVLTKSNIDGFFNFVFALSHIIQKCIIYPFPVRANPELFPSNIQIKSFEEAFKNHFTEYEHLLPPVQYFSSLIEFLKIGKRTKGCYVPHNVLATSGDGLLDACTCGPVKTLGNVLTMNADDLYNRIEKDPCYNNVKEPALSPICCHDCFTQYDMINLFFEGDISKAELGRYDFYAVPEVITLLSDIKKTIMTN